MSGRGWFALGFVSAATPVAFAAVVVAPPRWMAPATCWLLGCEPGGAIWRGNNGIEEGTCRYCGRHIVRDAGAKTP